MTYDDFFGTAMGWSPDGEQRLYDYQRRLACGERGGREDKAWLLQGGGCESRLIDVPTGLGKTAAVVLAWVWNRAFLKKEDWPRRLVYCLPMRTLVEQTQNESRKWLLRLARKYTRPQDGSELRWLALHSPVILMGGEELTSARGEWDIYPEKPAIIIGTQDMLLSRALNRGYGMSRYRWPMHFGLLNNDCLWVMDETQLMGVGVETSAQLNGFRHNEAMRTFGACPTWWMSATLDRARLATVDHPRPPDDWPVEKLGDAEESSGRPYELITATKKLLRAKLEDAASPVAITSKAKDYPKQIARLIKERHKPETLTLVVVNRVGRAQEIYEALTTPEKKSKEPLYNPDRVALIHSRFRPVDRDRHAKLLFGGSNGEGGRIVIATQAVEAGVDVSARLLITELAPWPSLVQRMGRCNRRAENPDAEVLWVDIEPKSENDPLALPYLKQDFEEARAAMNGLVNASPMALRKISVEQPVIRPPVVRRRDLLDLFDTTPDICGQDLDISRYIRDTDDTDVQFYWREVEGTMPPDDEAAPQRAELCRVSIGDAREFLKKKTSSKRLWRWNALEEKWEIAENAHPGATYLVDVNCGGYSTQLGWTKDPKDKATVSQTADGVKESYRRDPDSFCRSWQTLEEHTKLVVKATDALSSALALEPSWGNALHTAALWHDIGKAHSEFQKALRDGPHKPPALNCHYAKSANPPRPFSAHKEYRTIRHELASALTWLLRAPSDAAERDLIAYLIAAHHGKVRLSIRSLPDETGDPENPERLFARGIRDGEALPKIEFDGLVVPETSLDLSFMKMGEGPHGPSWLARTISLRDRLGPFRLAWLESLLRAADARASAVEPIRNLAHA